MLTTCGVSVALNLLCLLYISAHLQLKVSDHFYIPAPESLGITAIPLHINESLLMMLCYFITTQPIVGIVIVVDYLVSLVSANAELGPAASSAVR